MAFSYNANLNTPCDRVRFLVGDTVEARAALQDEEIDAVLALQTPNAAAVFYAAIECLQAMWAKWLASAGGIESKRVDGASWKYSSGASVEARVHELRRMALKALGRRPIQARARIPS